MTDIAKRVKALRLLRDIFMLTFIVGACSLILMVILLPLSSGTAQIPDALGVFIFVLDTIFTVLKLAAIVLFAITLILTIPINKECRLAFWCGVVAALCAILSGIFQYTLQSRMASYVLSMVCTLALVASIFLLVDGIFDQKARSTTIFYLMCVGIFLMVLAAVFEFIAFGAGLSHDVTSTFYLVSLIGYFLGHLIVFLSLNKGYRLVKTDKEVAAAQEQETK